ncbi:MAG: hypothetical protein GXO96_07380, partial [Nitrospirae bacterium]|nr:hypothetical protein [Candidatus Manganitrophaceae bacterium]
NGVLAFSDDPTLAPKGVKAEVWSLSSEQNISIIRRTKRLGKLPPEIVPTKRVEEDRLQISIPVVSQGAFAVQLVRELGLAQNISYEEAAETLSEIRISPTLGDWALDRAMTPTLTTRLRTLSVSATQMGWLLITPEQALLAFDTAAALTGLPIPQITETENRDVSNPLISVLPLVYISPPPLQMISSYRWIPVLNGFSFYGTTVHGYYALHRAGLNAHHFKGYRFAFNGRAIRHHFVNRLHGRHNKAKYVAHHPGRHKEHRSTAIFPSSQRIHQRQNILNLRHSQKSHLKKPHKPQDDLHSLSPHTKKHQPHVSTPRHRPRQKHIITKSHSLSKGHTNYKIHTASPRHGRRSGHIR